MMILKGDRAQLKNGESGEVIEVWGFADTFVRIKKDSDGRTIPVMASELVDIQRPKQVAKWGR